jgi:hypothetical protein
MTDRDHFAAAALTGLMANPKNNDTTADTIRFWAWNWADAMLRERERCPARMEFPTPPGEGWRWVEPHEPLERGDQCWSNEGRGWLPVTCYGDEWPIARQLFYRRRIDAQANHDAAPAARAQLPTGDHASGGSGSVGTDNADPLTRLGTGDTQEPVAWGVAAGGGVLATSISRIDAVDMQSDYECDTEVVPLYRSPTLTDAEREAISAARAAFGDLDEHEKLIAQLESQLDRCCKKLWVEWVPVAEQLPTRDQVVLVAWEGWELVTLGHFIDGDWFDPVVAISEYGPPTHWLPLPIGPRPPLPAPPTDGK